MAENLVKNTNTNTRLTNLETVIASIASHLGLTQGQDTRETESAPKTSVRLRQNREVSNFAKKAKQGHDDVVITLTDAMVDGRMKLPARMFTKGSKVVVDGHTFTQQAADQNRSTKFNPEIFGYEVEAGDVFTFEHVSGREWTVASVAEGQAPKKAPAKAKPSAKVNKQASKPSAKPSAGSGKLRRDEQGTESVTQFISRFAKLAIANGNDDDFEENENIKQTGTFDVDARVYLTTAENQKFRSGRKALGLTLKKAVSLLNAAVYED